MSNSLYNKGDMKVGIYNKKQQGVVSLFTVIFSTLLISVVTVGFIRIMITGQQQASSTDLSQSAYDSALVGVEDAKRALLRYQNICDSGDAEACAEARVEINSSTCNKAVSGLEGVAEVDGAVKVQTNGADNILDQAYTCLKINLNTSDYLGVLSKDESKFIPIRGTSTFDSIKIEWFSAEDLSSNNNSLNFNLVSPIKATTTPLSANWDSETPPIMRAQLVQFNTAGFNLSDLDSNSNNNSSNTLFLYPSSVGSNSTSFASDSRLSSKSIQPVKCSGTLGSGGYACTTTITLPTAVNANDSNTYLRLTSIYNLAHYRVTLSNSVASEVVKFDSVQPEIDSTGRANTLFRRVQSRVELVNATFPYPEAAVDTSGNLCKNFVVTNNVADYVSSCTP